MIGQWTDGPGRRLASWETATETLPRSLARARRTGRRVGVILFEPCLDRDEAGQLAFVDALLRAVRGEDVAFETADGHVAVLAEEVDGFPDLRVLSRRIHGELQASGRAPTGCWMSVCDARGRFISTVEVGPVAV